MRRVVVTGMGLVTPLGIGLEQVWRRLLAGESGIRAIQSFDVSDLPSRVAAQVPRGDKESGLFNADDWVPPKDQRRMDEFIVYAMAAADMAVEDAGWQPGSEEERERTGVMIGSGIGGLPTIYEASVQISQGKARVYHGEILAVRTPIGPFVVALSYGADFQRGDVRTSLLSNETVVRHIVRLRLTAAPTRRAPDR